jgi:hypothetical protein
MMKSLTKLAFLLIAVIALIGCGKQEETALTPKYPSWSVFEVASENGLIDGDEGKLGALERKHNIDIVREAE